MMSDSVKVALIMTIGTTIPSIGAFVTALLTKAHIKELAINTNSIKDELVAATQKGAFAEGVKAEKDNPTP